MKASDPHERLLLWAQQRPRPVVSTTSRFGLAPTQQDALTNQSTTSHPQTSQALAPRGPTTTLLTPRRLRSTESWQHPKAKQPLLSLGRHDLTPIGGLCTLVQVSDRTSGGGLYVKTGWWHRLKAASAFFGGWVAWTNTLPRSDPPPFSHMVEASLPPASWGRLVFAHCIQPNPN